jgi:putative tricarboxylic transport membrane protein
MSDDAGSSSPRPSVVTVPQAVGSAAFAAIGFAIFAFVYVNTLSFSPEARTFPRFVAIVGMLGAAIALIQSLQAVRAARNLTNPSSSAEDAGPRRSDLWVSYLGPPLYGALLLIFGFWIASAAFLAGLLIVLGERRPAMVSMITIGTVGAIYLVFEVAFNIRLPGSLLLQMMTN